jgi:hypothetical protein
MQSTIVGCLSGFAVAAAGAVELILVLLRQIFVIYSLDLIF